jgi:hypothetical protein
MHFENESSCSVPLVPNQSSLTNRYASGRAGQCHGSVSNNCWMRGNLAFFPQTVSRAATSRHSRLR